METSRSEPSERDDHAEIDPAALDISPEPSPETVAAIVAALQSYRRSQLRATEDEDTEQIEGWQRSAWQFAGRYELMGNARVNPDARLPADPWSAAHRLDRG